MLFLLSVRVGAGDAIVRRGDVVVALLIVERLADRRGSEGRLDAAFGVGLALLLPIFFVDALVEIVVIRIVRVAPAAEQAPELAAGMHDVMHRRADPGIGPFAGSPAAWRP